MVFAQFLGGDPCLFRLVVRGADDLILPPLVAARRRKHTSHEVIPAVSVGEGVQGIVRVHAELVRGDEDGSGGTQADIAAASTHGTSPHSSCGIVASARTDHDAFREANGFSYLRQERSYRLPALVELRELLFSHAADLAHLLAPTFVFHIKKKHPGSIGVVRGVDAGKAIDQIVFGKHNLLNFCE